MTIWQPILDGRSGPLYIQIANALHDDIASGALRAGDRLPTHRDLAYRLHVTVGTVSRAYAEAMRRNLISGEVGRGTFIAADAGLPDTPSASGTLALPDSSRASVAAPEAEASSLHRIHARAEAAGSRLDLSLNYPCDALLGDALRGGLENLLRKPDLLRAVCRYQPALGLASHREAAALWLREFGVDATANDVLIVPGCQGGLSTVFLALCRPGDVVLHEALTWPGLHATAAQLGVRTSGVRMDAQGLDPEALDAACRQLRPKLLYTMPTLHNPTCTVMPEERRRAIIDVAQRHSLFVVEDDVYGFLLEDRPPPLRNALRERGLYVTSLSKSVAPGLRVGFVVAPQGLLGKLADALRMNLLMTSSLAVEVASAAIRSGAAAESAAAQRREAQARQMLAAELLAGFSFRAHRSAFHGWLAVPTPWRRTEFEAALNEHGVSVTPGPTFAGPVASAEAEAHVRLCLSAIGERQRLATALSIVAEVGRRGGTPSQLPVV